MDPAAAFRQLVNSSPDPALDDLCFAVAACFRPADGIARARDALDHLAANVGEPNPAGVCRVVFGSGGFRGDEADYYAPENSLLDAVVERRLGMPITLAVVLIEVGRRAGVHFEGVAMPGHFVVRDADGAIRDPFAGGVVRSREECAVIVRKLLGDDAPAFDDRWLEPVAPAVIVTRILANLERSLRLRNRRAEALTALELRAVVPGALDARGLRQAADALAEGGRFDRAAQLYEGLAASHPNSARELRRQAAQLRARLN